MHKASKPMMDLLNDLFFQLKYRHPIYINAYVNRDYNKPYSRNWGDDINYWFLREIIKPKIRLYNESPIAFRRNYENYLVIGSTISLLTKSNTIVWGAGCITDEGNLPAIPKKILAVRGPLTHKYLKSKGIDCPEVYGDPALLLPFHYNPLIEKRYKIGLIQHVSEKTLNITGCHSISMSEYGKWTDVIDEICACEVVASSSLHGLIVAEAYGIPNVWVETKRLLGGHFKFHDFFQSIGADRDNPINLTENLTSKDLIRYAVTPNAKNLDITPLIESCPFPLTIQRDY